MPIIGATELQPVNILGSYVQGLEAGRANQLAQRRASQEEQLFSQRMATGQAEQRRAELEARLKGNQIIADMASSAVDQPSYEAALRSLASIGVDVSGIPPMFDPKFVAQQKQLALTEAQRIDAELKRRELGVREGTVRVQELQALTAAERENRLAAPPRAAGGGVATLSAMPSVEPPKLKQGERWNPQTQRVEIVPGSDLYNKSKKIHSADFSTLRGVEGQRNLAIQKIDKLLAPENAGAFENLFGGYNAYVTSQLSGKTADLKNQLESLKSNLKTAGLQLIKTGSGGAIGQITEREWPILEGMIATLSPTMTEEEARNALGGIKTFMQNLATNAQETYDASWAESQFYKAPPDKPPSDKPPSKLSPEDQQALDWANANPNDPRAAKIKAALGAK